MSVDKYRELFIETNFEVNKNSGLCYYSLLVDKIFNKEHIKRFKLNLDKGMEVYYNSKLVQIIKSWDLTDMLEFKMFISIQNKSFGKDGFENFLVLMKDNEEMKNEFFCDVVESPFCNLRDLEYLYGRHGLIKLLGKNNAGYTKFTKFELDEYQDHVCWDHILVNKKDIKDSLLSRYRKKIKEYIHKNYSNTQYQEMKYISFWLCLNEDTDWERVNRYLKSYNYSKNFLKESVKELSRTVKFPKNHYFEYFINKNNSFECYHDNIDCEELQYNKHLPTEVIEIFVQQVIDKKTVHYFGDYYNLTIQQFVKLCQVDFKLYSKIRYQFNTFGVYQYKKYKKLIEENPIIMEKFSYMLTNSDNGSSEFYNDHNHNQLIIN